jgi:hypothetical protein
LSPAHRGLPATPGSLKTKFCPVGRRYGPDANVDSLLRQSASEAGQNKSPRRCAGDDQSA